MNGLKKKLMIAFAVITLTATAGTLQCSTLGQSLTNEHGSIRMTEVMPANEHGSIRMTEVMPSNEHGSIRMT